MTPQFLRFRRIRSQFAVSLILVMTLALNVQAQNADSKPRTVTVKQGQILEMALVTRLNSSHAKVGDAVVLKLTKPLMADGTMVLPAKWMVYGRVTDVKHAAKNCQPGSIHWALESVAMTDGRKFEIHSIDNIVAARSLRDQVARNTAAPKAGEKTTGKKGSRANSIAEIALLPVVIVYFSARVLSEIRYGDEACRGGKGREESILGGQIFYAEISNDVQQIVD
jgi:hypothetical protein